MKRIVTLVLIVCMMFMFSSCASKALDGNAKTFTVKDISITLTDSFKKKEQQGYTRFFAASDAAVIFLEEQKNELKDISDMDGYIDAVYKNNTANNMTEIMTEDGIPYFEFTADIKRKEYKYMACFYEDSDAFWIIQFYCESDKYLDLKDDFLSWAKTVTLGN